MYVCMYIYIYYGHISVSSPVFTRTRFSDGFCIVPLLQDLAKLVADQELLAQAMETMAGGEEKWWFLVQITSITMVYGRYIYS